MNKDVHKVGFWAGLSAFASTLAYFVAQLLQIAGALTYPWDEILIYGFSLAIAVPFLLAMLALHYVTPADKQFWSHGALIFTAVYVVFVTSNYVVQLATVIPMTLKGAAADISILVQTPHSLFWDFDAIGYIFMGFATFMALPVFQKYGFQQRVRLVFLAHGLTTPLIAFVYFYPDYSETLLFLGIPWAITAPAAMLMLAMMFANKRFQGSVKVAAPHRWNERVTIWNSMD